MGERPTASASAVVSTTGLRNRSALVVGIDGEEAQLAPDPWFNLHLTSWLGWTYHYTVRKARSYTAHYRATALTAFDLNLQPAT